MASVVSVKTVLLTGATGFIGKHLIPILQARGFTVHATYRERPPIAESAVVWHAVDLHISNAVTRLLEKIAPSHLIHAAWYAKPENYKTSMENVKWVNSGLDLLAAFMNAGGKRAVFLGSCMEYQWREAIYEENKTLCLPGNVYGAAKHSLYLLGKAIATQRQISFAWARIFFLFGPEEYRERLIPYVILSLLKEKNCVVKQGYLARDFLYVKEVADAMVALLESEVEGAVNIASGQAVKIKELILHIERHISSHGRITYQEQAAAEPIVIQADPTRLTKEVGWQPKYSLEKAIEETIAWWRGQAI